MPRRLLSSITTRLQPWFTTSRHQYIITERLRASITASHAIITATTTGGVGMIINGEGMITGIIATIVTTIDS